MSPTIVVHPLIDLIGSKSIPMMRLLMGMCFTATWSHPPAHASSQFSWQERNSAVVLTHACHVHDAVQDLWLGSTAKGIIV